MGLKDGLLDGGRWRSYNFNNYIYKIVIIFFLFYKKKSLNTHVVMLIVLFTFTKLSHLTKIRTPNNIHTPINNRYLYTKQTHFKN